MVSPAPKLLTFATTTTTLVQETNNKKCKLETSMSINNSPMQSMLKVPKLLKSETKVKFVLVPPLLKQTNYIPLLKTKKNILQKKTRETFLPPPIPFYNQKIMNKTKIKKQKTQKKKLQHNLPLFFPPPLFLNQTNKKQKTKNLLLLNSNTCVKAKSVSTTAATQRPSSNRSSNKLVLLSRSSPSTSSPLVLLPMVSRKPKSSLNSRLRAASIMTSPCGATDLNLNKNDSLQIILLSMLHGLPISDPEMAKVAKSLEPIWTQGTWNSRKSMLNRFLNYLKTTTTSNNLLSVDLDFKMASFVESIATLNKASSKLTYAKNLKAISKAFGLTATPVLNLYIAANAAAS